MMKRYLEWLATFFILFGLFSLCQPFTMLLYRYGFAILLIGTLLFIIVVHLK